MSRNFNCQRMSMVASSPATVGSGGLILMYCTLEKGPDISRTLAVVFLSRINARP